MAAILEVTDTFARVQPGLPVVTLKQALAADRRYYPPAPTYDGAFVGGTISTNASGAATFKYGSTRNWVRGLTVVLACGEVLDLERGRVHAHPDGYFEIETSGAAITVPVPTYRMPDVPKRSAGYFAAPGMDLIDLFIGAEGTLGVVVEATLGIVTPAPATCLALVPFPDEARALAVVADLRERSRRTWRERDPRGLDVSAIEMLDRRCLAMLHEDGSDAKHGISLPPDTDVALLVQLELAAGHDGRGGLRPDRVGAGPGRRPGAARPVLPTAGRGRRARSRGGRRARRPGARAAVLRLPRGGARGSQAASGARQGAGRPGHPEDRGRHDRAVRPLRRDDGDLPARLRAARPAVRHLGTRLRRQRPPERDPATLADVEAGQEAILEFGREVVARGGSPLSEHGVGRSAIKQALLRQLYGDRGIDEMRAVKRALDPEWKLAPGVIFAP